MPQFMTLIVEDHPLYRNALRLIVESSLPDSVVVAVGTLREALEIVSQQKDQLRLVLLDMGLVDVSGVEAIRKLRELSQPNILVISASEERRDVHAALKAGALAFISKAVSEKVLEATIERAFNGLLTTPQWITAEGEHRLQPALQDKELLTSKQHTVLNLVAMGYSNKDIAYRMDISEITVKKHLSAIFQILDVCNRTQAVNQARHLGLLGYSEDAAVD